VDNRPVKTSKFQQRRVQQQRFQQQRREREQRDGERKKPTERQQQQRGGRGGFDFRRDQQRVGRAPHGAGVWRPAAVGAWGALHAHGLTAAAASGGGFKAS
jgi:hypothetical protein